MTMWRHLAYRDGDVLSAARLQELEDEVRRLGKMVPGNQSAGVQHYGDSGTLITGETQRTDRGPWTVEVRRRGTAAHDSLRVGPDRSVTFPGVIVMDAAMRSITTPDDVPLWTMNPTTPIAQTDDTRLLCVRAVSSTGIIAYEYVWAEKTGSTAGHTYLADIAAGPDVYWPLAWVHARTVGSKNRIQATIGTGQQDVVALIAKQAPVALVDIDSGTGQTYIGDVFGNGQHAPETESNVTIKALLLEPTDALRASNVHLAIRHPWPTGYHWTVTPPFWD